MESHQRAGRNVLLALVLLVVVAVPLFAVSAYAAGNPAASGGGTTVELGEKSTFTFNAVQKPNGTVTGHLVYHFRAVDNSFHMDIDCLSIEGNNATLSGVVTHITGKGIVPDFLFVGQHGVFSVTDNGEGADAQPDLISDVTLDPAASCEGGLQLTYLPIDGNVQVSE